MNEIVNKFLLTGDKFMTEMYLRQPGFTYSACDPFTKNKGILFKGVFIPKLLNNCLACCSLTNFAFLLLHTSHFDKSITLPFLVFTAFGFLHSVFLLHFKHCFILLIR